MCLRLEVDRRPLVAIAGIVVVEADRRRPSSPSAGRRSRWEGPGELRRSGCGSGTQRSLPSPIVVGSR